MSSIVTEQGIVHYETYGQGKPVVLLHGWLGSWGIWHQSMASLGRYYRTYALDFWGFGESGKKRDTYNIDDFVALVDQFMSRLGIMSAPLVGHSMGGTVGLSVAVRYPQRVKKVVVVSSPIIGSSLNPLLRMAGYRPVAKIVYKLPSILRLGIRVFSPLISKNPDWYDMQKRDLSRTTLESFLLSIASLRRTDLRPQLAEIKVPTLGIYGVSDNIVSPKQNTVLAKSMPHAQIEMMKGSKHFPMLDEPERFDSMLRAFLDAEAPFAAP